MGDTRRSAIEWALELAHRGFKIFPLRPDSKEPYPGQSWTSIMTTDAGTIKGWFREREGMNYGACPGLKNVIVDLDVKEAANGIDAFDLLELNHGEVETFRVDTPSGGQHIYLSVEEPASNAHRFPAGIDVRGAHGYVVGPGCQLSNGGYAVVDDTPIISAPAWVADRLKQHTDKESRELEPLFDLDTPEAVSRAREFLKHRDPAIEGLSGDFHTLVTAQCIIDFGISQDKTLDLLTEEFKLEGETEALSWNDRCVPPWDIDGRKNTLEEKVRNAWNYRNQEPGSKGGGVVFDDVDLKDAVDIATLNSDEGKEQRFARILGHLYKGKEMLNRGKSREFVIPEWLPAHGFTALLSRRGGGKTVVALDMALRIACGMEWHGYPIKENMYAIYIAGEDDEGAEEQVRAWCKSHDMDSPPDRFIFIDIITNLMDAEDTREWAEALRSVIGQDGRAVLFLDTWQRASSRGGQNRDDDMQTAVHHAEALAASLDGPAVIAFHPPKADDRMVMGSSVIENSTTAIWHLADHAVGKKLEVTRMKGRGENNYQMFKFEEIKLGEEDEFGRERTGIVPVRIGGVGMEGVVTEGEGEALKAFANVLRELELRRKEDDPNSSKHYAVTGVAKIIADELPGRADIGDEWAEGLLNELRNAGTVSLKSWKRISERILELFKDPRGYDFGDGYALRVYLDGKSRRIKIDKSGISS